VRFFRGMKRSASDLAGMPAPVPAAVRRRAGGGSVPLALVLLAATVVVTVALGRWQLGRADEKAATLAALEAGRTLPPLALGPGRAGEDLIPWRSAQASGHWLADRTVLLDNRMADGRPGFWVVTPLAFDGEGRQAVAVLRGWLPRPVPDAPVTVRTPTGPVTVRGELVPRVPRLFELPALSGRKRDELASSLPGWPGAPPRVQNLELDAYAKATGVALLPAVLEQTGDAPDGLVRDWAGPPTNIDTHRGYALQWFSFAAIAAIAFGVILVRVLRPKR